MSGDVAGAVGRLLDFAHARLLLDAADDDIKRNELSAMLADDPALAERFCAGCCDDDDSDRLLGAVAPLPSAVAAQFAQIERALGPMEAMGWLYLLSCDLGYVKKSRLDANPRFEDGGLTVTINRAKPEFRTMEQAGSGNAVGGGGALGPQCTICHGNEGYGPRSKRTLRTVPVELDGERWFWQFSPYGYFPEHGICVNARHTPMKVGRRTFVQLLDFVDRFPGYFIGCNAALPRIGGSVLAHDHFQGGAERLPIFDAAPWGPAWHAGDGGAFIEILDWPGTALRVTSPSRDGIVEACDAIRRRWETYDEPSLGLHAQGPRGRQSALSPTVIRTPGGYAAFLTLRNNAVSERYPQGVYHAHPQYWCIKQEPIGLIEAQGLFILPARLEGQLAGLARALRCQEEPGEELAGFDVLWRDMRRRIGGVDEARRLPRTGMESAMRAAVAAACRAILANTATLPTYADTAAFLESAGFTRTAPMPAQ